MFARGVKARRWGFTPGGFWEEGATEWVGEEHLSLNCKQGWHLEARETFKVEGGKQKLRN